MSLQYQQNTQLPTVHYHKQDTSPAIHDV